MRVPIAVGLLLSAHLLNAAVAEAGPNSEFDVKSFGATADGVNDDQRAIQSAIDAAVNAGGGTVLFPPGTYLHSDVLTAASSVILRGSGSESILKAANPQRSTIHFVNASNCGVQNLSIDGTSIPRLVNGESTGLWLSNASHCTLTGIFIDGGASAGILVDGSSTDIQITGNDVRNTMADGIHITGGSNDVTVADNIAYNTGDDSYAAVAYAHDLVTSGVLFRNNSSTNSKARGVACIGANHCTISNNTVINPAAHGIAVAFEQVYDTFHPSSATVTQNTIIGAGKSGMNGILVAGAQTVTLAGNQVSQSNSILINESDSVTINDLRLQDIAGVAIAVRHSTNVAVTGVRLSGSSGPGISLENVTQGQISRNRFIDPCLEHGIAAIVLARSSDVSGSGNVLQDSAASRSLRLIDNSGSSAITLDGSTAGGSSSTEEPEVRYREIREIRKYGAKR